MKDEEVLDALNEISRLADLIQRWVPLAHKADIKVRIHDVAIGIESIARKTIRGIK